jgi:preprotein translocase subunit SecD
MSSSKRNTLILAILAAGAGYLFFRNDSFWGVVTSGILVAWCIIGLLPIMDGIWRIKVGFVAATFFAASIALWPTLAALSGDRIKCPEYIKNNIGFAIAPGLDLRGGLRLVYTVEVEEAIRDKRDYYADEIRQELARTYQFHSGDSRVTRDELTKLEEKVHVSTPESALIAIQFKEAADTNKLDERFTKRFGQDLAQQRGAKPGEVIFKIRAETESALRDTAVGQARETVSKRVDELGLREASVTVRDEDIIVEVPGDNEKAFNEIKEIIRKTARLEFKMVDDPADFFGKIKDSEIPEGEGISIYTESAPNGPGKTITNHYARIVKRENETMLQARDRLKAWTSKLNVPDDHQIGFHALTEFDPDTNVSTEVGWMTYYLYSRAELTGDYITDARRAQDTQNGRGEWFVSITFNQTGADRFEEVTGANVQRRFAIILDDVVDSAPRILGKIAGGQARITMGAGNTDEQAEQARKLELVLRSGALPAPISPSNESYIGPSLGRDAIAQGLKGMTFGILAVLTFMFAYYRGSGVVANIAVLFNMLIQLAVLASFSATMTLPGIAGLALTIGMAVDANVLINERIREELRAGRSVRAAVDAGYSKAFMSILDGHVTVFISGLILAQFGTGPVKGFAITLIVGIVASLFTGVFCTRLVFDYWVRGAKLKRLSVGAEF